MESGKLPPRGCPKLRNTNQTLPNILGKYYLPKLTLAYGFHPVNHGLIPDLQSDDVIGNEAEEPDQAFLDVVGPGCQDLPMAANFGVIGRVRENALDKDIWKNS